MRKEERLLSEICDSAISKLESIKKLSELAAGEKWLNEKYLSRLKPLVANVSKSKKPYIGAMNLTDFEVVNMILGMRKVVYSNLLHTEDCGEAVVTVSAQGADMVCIFIPSDVTMRTLPRYFDSVDEKYIPHQFEIVEWYEENYVPGYVVIMPFAYLYGEIEKADEFLAMVVRQIFGKDSRLTSDDLRKALM